MPSRSRALRAGTIKARLSIIDISFSSSLGIGSPIVRIGRNRAIRLDYLLTSIGEISSTISKLDLRFLDYMLSKHGISVSCERLIIAI